MEPPAAGSSHAPFTGIVIVEDVYGQHGRTVAARGTESRVVGEAQILAEPDNDGTRSGHRIEDYGEGWTGSIGRCVFVSGNGL